MRERLLQHLEVKAECIALETAAAGSAEAALATCPKVCRSPYLLLYAWGLSELSQTSCKVTATQRGRCQLTLGCSGDCRVLCGG